MITAKKHWVLSLGILLSLSLALPFCCHIDMSERFSHHKEMQAHSGHGQHSDASDCKCGHEFVKDYQKNKKLVNTQYFPGPLGIELLDSTVPPIVLDLPSSFLKFQPGLLNHNGPPLHLLFSVFLN